MPVNAYNFIYNNLAYSFNVKPVSDDLFKVQFLNPIDNLGLPQQFWLNTQFVLVFLLEEPNAVYSVTREAKDFLTNFSADLKQYIFEFAS